MTNSGDGKAEALHGISAVISNEERLLTTRAASSARMSVRARKALAGGANSNWQMTQPQAIWASRAAGSKVVDVDGNEYVDMHGRDVMLVGHAHPRIVEAVQERITQGSFVAQPTEDAIVVAEELQRRFQLPLWRFSNSGTEATMDAVHLMRAWTGRDHIVKVDGAYHGHHDSVMVDIDYALDTVGIPAQMLALTHVIPFNDLEALECVFAAHRGEIAGIILEPVMLNAGVIPPDENYLQGVVDLAHGDGALVAFDEVKSGFTIGPGGASGHFGVRPDILCLGKALGGGLPCGAVGGSEVVMELIASGKYQQVGTFNGNPLTMAASRAAVCEILDARAYQIVARLREDLVKEIGEVIRRLGVVAHIVAIGAKGAIFFSPSPVRTFRDYQAIDSRTGHCHWLFQANRGVLLPPEGKSWLLSVQHTAEDMKQFAANFEEFAHALGY